jgi:outer membrane protein assembly factor BamB
MNKIAARMFIAGTLLFGLSCSARAAQPEAQQILAAAGVQGGLIVHLGCGDGKLTAALRANDAYLVHGLDADAKNIAAARKYIQSLGLYGKVSVEQWTGDRLPYADNLVNLLVISDASAKIADEEIRRVLAPRGTAIFLNPKSKTQNPKFTKPWPQEIDEWTHYLHGPDNNAVAKDRVVGPPQGVQWVAGPLWQRHHEMNANPNALVSAKGRLFYIYDEAPATVAGLPDRWVLAARDAFSGVLLWERPVGDWGWKAWSAVETGGRFNLPIHTPRRLVAVGDRVFVTLGFNAPLTALDAATGKTVKTYDGTESTDEILASDGLLVLSVNQAPQKPAAVDRRRQKKNQAKASEASPTPGPTEQSAGVKKRIVVLKADTGEILWTQGDYTGVSSSPILGNLEQITRLLMAVGSGKVVCVEKDAIVALDLNTGRQLWRRPRPNLPAKPGERENLYNFSTLVIHQDVVLFLQTEESYALPGTANRGVHCRLIGLSADTGNVLWTLPCSKWGPASEGDVFVINDLAWTHAADEYALIGIDLHSGQVKRKIQDQAVFDEVHHHRCFRNKATERYVLTARRGIETIDLEHEQTGKNEWVRGACRYGILPCNGLIYVPPHPCQCYIDVKLSGFYALTSAAASRPAEPDTRQGARLQRGPAYSSIHNPQSPIPNPSEWPTYRHDIQRSGATTAEAPAALQRLWEAHLGGRTSACTIGGGRVFSASVDQHRVVALDEKDGRTVWDYTVGGRVDTPPTVDGDRVLLGSADGWVYCLRAADGLLAWRFRAAPDETRIVAHGQLESLWPVHGTVLLSNGVAYVAAGRSTHLDGGIRLYALEPGTGELIRQLRPSNSDPQGLDDVLVGDGDRVYMRHLEFRLQDEPSAAPQQTDQGPAAWSLRAYSTAGLLDDSYFARVAWSTRSQVGKRGKTKVGKNVEAADLLIFDGQSTFTFRSRRQGGFGGWFQAGAGAYELAALDNQTGKPRWTLKIPLRVRALAAAGQVLFAAGPRDAVDPKDPWASVEGRAGGVLWALAAADGKKLGEYPLDAAPAWDGLAIGNHKIFLSSLDGKVICLGGKP